jgi:hypothetical protein
MIVVCIHHESGECVVDLQICEYARPHEKTEWDDPSLVCPLTGLDGGYMEVKE